MRAMFHCLVLLILVPVLSSPVNVRADDTPLLRALDSLVRVNADIAPDGRTAQALGTEREGTGIVVDDSGLVLTIGYLILEAMATTVTDIDGNPIAADVVAYDHATGLGLLRAQRSLRRPPARLGDSSGLSREAPALVAGHGGPESAWPVAVADIRDFSAYWEYLLEDALFTMPPVPAWQGAALFGPDGRLLGVGSLFVPDARRRPSRRPGNMFVPIDSLKPVLGDMLTAGRGVASERPWLGIFTNDHRGYVVVTYVAADGPSEAAGLRPGDIVLEVDGERVRSMAEMYRKVWTLGNPGVAVPLTLGRQGGFHKITVTSGDRYKYLKWDSTY